MTTTTPLAQPVTLTDDEAADLYSHAVALVVIHRGRIPSTVDLADVKQNAAILAWNAAATGLPLRDAARLGAYRAYQDALNTPEHVSRQESIDTTDAATVDTLDTLQRYSPPRPDTIATTTDADTLADPLDALLCADEDAAAILAAALTLDPADGRAWRNGLPSASPMLAATGAKNTGRARAAMAQSIGGAFTLAQIT